MSTRDRAIFGSGCFWCTEAIFERLEGVLSVMPGYAGGEKADPTYEDVCSGVTGHAEVAEILFDPGKIKYENLLDIFWECHDPTSLNRQGADVGTQYRSVIFYDNEIQKTTAESSRLLAQKNFADPIVTQILPLHVFYPAEDYHRKYYTSHPNAPYCRFVIKPKLDKLQKRQ